MIIKNSITNDNELMNLCCTEVVVYCNECMPPFLVESGVAVMYFEHVEHVSQSCCLSSRAYFYESKLIFFCDETHYESNIRIVTKIYKEQITPMMKI